MWRKENIWGFLILLVAQNLKSSPISKTNYGKKKNSWLEGKAIILHGKAILIKSMLQAISTFAMIFFKMLEKLCQDLHSLIRRFWWCNNGERMGIPWIAWEKLCRQKRGSGMGFIYHFLFNQAFLANQGSR